MFVTETLKYSMCCPGQRNEGDHSNKADVSFISVTDGLGINGGSIKV